MSISVQNLRESRFDWSEEDSDEDYSLLSEEDSFISESSEESLSEEEIPKTRKIGGHALRSRAKQIDYTDSAVQPGSKRKVVKNKAPAPKRQKQEIPPTKAISETVGREEEARRLMLMLAQPTPQCPLLIGPAGIGKKKILDKLNGYLQRKECPDFLKERKIIRIDCKELLGKSQSQGGSEGETKYFLEVIRKIRRKVENPIFFFQDIDDVTTSEGAIHHIFQSFLQDHPAVIGTISDSEKSEKTQQTVNTLRKYNFLPIHVQEPSKEETGQIIRQHLKEVPLPFGLQIEPSAIEIAVDLAGRYLKEQPFPIKAIQLVYEAATHAGMNGSNSKKITESDIAEVMQFKTGLPAEQLSVKDTTYLHRLYQSIREQIVGQNHAVETVFQGVKRGKMGFRDRKKPWGVYLFVGPTGVGKTELAKTVARELNCHFLRFDMGEYQEPHSLARMIGSPPGYVGHEAGGALTNGIRQHPHSIVLFDEMEKAHPDVANTLLQVFDDGRLTDGLGNTIDCTESIFIMTSNLGAKTLFSAKKAPMHPEQVLKQIIPLIIEKWSPEFLGRITSVIPFESLSSTDYPRVIEVHLKKLAKEVLEQHRITLDWNENVIPYLLKKHSSDIRTGIRGLCEKVKIEVYDLLADARESGSLENKFKVQLDVQRSKLFAHTSRR